MSLVTRHIHQISFTARDRRNRAERVMNIVLTDRTNNISVLSFNQRCKFMQLETVSTIKNTVIGFANINTFIHAILNVVFVFSKKTLKLFYALLFFFSFSFFCINVFAGNNPPNNEKQPCSSNKSIQKGEIKLSDKDNVPDKTNNSSKNWNKIYHLLSSNLSFKDFSNGMMFAGLIFIIIMQANEDFKKKTIEQHFSSVKFSAIAPWEDGKGYTITSSENGYSLKQVKKHCDKMNKNGCYYFPIPKLAADQLINQKHDSNL